MGKSIILLVCLAIFFLSGCLEETQTPTPQPTQETSPVDTAPPKHYPATQPPTFEPVVACPEDAKICPDGSVVVRVSPDCEFVPCPEIAQQTHAPFPETPTDILPPEHYPETPKPTFEPICREGDARLSVCPDGVITYPSENCIDGVWVTINYIRDPCSPLPTKEPSEKETTWVEIEPVQCLENTWEQDWLRSHKNDYSSYPTDNEFEIIKDFYNKQGVTIIDVQSEKKYEVVCLACSCPRGDVLSLLVFDSDVESMLDLGFKLSGNL
jgi:hypothetical protein